MRDSSILPRRNDSSYPRRCQHRYSLSLYLYAAYYSRPLFGPDFSFLPLLLLDVLALDALNP
jgi:hypothetical protein